MGENRKFVAIVTATLTQRKTNSVITMADVVSGLRAAVSDAVERAHLLERILILHPKTTVLRKGPQKIIDDYVVRHNISKKLKFTREALVAFDIVATSLVDMPLSKFDESPSQCLNKSKVLRILKTIEGSIGSGPIV